MLKNRNGNYYTRITFPLVLKQSGCPAEVRISLQTKEYSLATMRNLLVAHALKSLTVTLATQLKHTQASSVGLRPLLESELAKLRRQLVQSEWVAQTLSDQSDDKIVIPPDRLLIEPPQPLQRLSDVTLGALQAEFITRKSQDSISLRSVQQLQTRTSELIKLLGADCAVADVKFRQVDAFMLHLANKGLKEKTIREYKTACSQMMEFAINHEHMVKNPFDQIKVKNSKATPRSRWTRPQLKKLFATETFSQPNPNTHPDDYWVPLLMLHTAARPSEVCQLRPEDVVVLEGLTCLNITDEGVEQSLKNKNSKRLVPIHSKLIELGFLQYVQQKRKQGHKQLFNCKPTGEFKEWSKNFETRFSRNLSKLGFVAGQRPTAYGFRHTIIDELQQLDAPEHVVADLVGHSKEGFTYKQYGKQTQIQRLKALVERLDFCDELASVASWKSTRHG